MTVTEALWELAQWDGRDILTAADAKGIAAAFGLEPTVYSLAETYRHGECLDLDPPCELGVMALTLLVQIAQCTGVCIESGYLSPERRYMELLWQMHQSVDPLA